VNDFVEQCRREWRRLGVSRRVADDMAAELDADLLEAERDGLEADEVVGVDPRSFAASWAAERGVIRRRPVRRSRITTAIAAFAPVVVIGAVLMALPAPSAGVLHGRTIEATPQKTVFTITATSPSSGVDAGSIGAILLGIGLAGLVPAALAARWIRPSS
jgi:hypothetical protein